MAQIFISYAREDRLWAEALSNVFQRRNWSVWWDRDLTYGQSFPEEIERELEAAACVIVLWSKDAIASSWVKTEASEGAARDVLVPIFIEEVRLPLEFRRLHTGDLSGWDRETETPAVLACVNAVRLLLERHKPPPVPSAPEPIAPQPIPESPPRPPWQRTLTILVIVATLVALGVLLPFVWRRDPKPPDKVVATETHTGPVVDTVSTQPTETVASGQDPLHQTDRTTTVETSPASPVPGMIGAGFSPRGFAEYVKLQKFDWRPQFIVVHHTSAPTLAEWKRMSGEQRMDQMAALFKQRGWSGGPHLFIDDNQIWVLNPLTKPGIHAASWNKISFGVEIVGDYDKEPFEGRLRDNTVSAIATLSAALGLDAQTLRFHSDQPRQGTPSGCPGAHVKKDDLIRRVQQDVARRRLAT